MTILYLLLNLLVLGGLIFWLWQLQARARAGLKKIFFPALALKLLCGIGLGLLYQYYYGGGDTFGYHHQSLFLYDYFLDNPRAYLQLWLTDRFESETVRTSMVYPWYSNSYFMVIWLSLLDILTGGQYFLNSLYFSLFSFWGTWQLVRALAALNPRWQPAAVVALLFLPSAVFWSSGINKETVYLGALCWFLASLLQVIHLQERKAWFHWAGLLASGYVLWKIKFYFAAVVFPLAGSYALLSWVMRRFPVFRSWRIQALCFGLVLIVAVGIMSQLHHVFHLHYFLTELMESHQVILSASAGKPVLQFPDLQPSLGSVLAHAPLAAFYAAFRPFIWEGEGLLYAFAGGENGLVLVLGIWALVRAGKPGMKQWNWFLLILIGYCLVIAALIGLSTPNVGSLSRYKTAFQPLLVFVLLTGLSRMRWRGKQAARLPGQQVPGCAASQDQLPLEIK
ncbi:MAG: hypothetical protein ACO1NZ_14335 [Adhaeribacter sp.]